MPMLVAPIVPEYNPAGAQLMLQGFQAVAQRNAQRRANELQSQKIMQDDVQAERAGQLARERMDIEARLKMQDLELTREKMGMEVYLKEQEFDLYRKGYKGRQSAAESVTDFNRRKAAEEQAFFEKAKPLFDPNPKNPIKFYAEVERLEDEYRFSQLSTIKNALTELRSTTEKHTLPMPQAPYLEDDGTTWHVGTMLQVPVGQIVKNLKDPLLHDATVQKLDAAGYLKGPEKSKAKLFDTGIPSQSVARPYLEMGKDVDFSPGKPSGTVSMMRGADETEIPDEVLFPETEKERKHKQAKAAEAKGGDRAKIIEQWVKDGFDAAEY